MGGCVCVVVVHDFYCRDISSLRDKSGRRLPPPFTIRPPCPRGGSKVLDGTCSNLRHRDMLLMVRSFRECVLGHGFQGQPGRTREPNPRGSILQGFVNPHDMANSCPDAQKVGDSESCTIMHQPHSCRVCPPLETG